ncbi:MAG TPA: HAMP domain-containing sensor histidine kinase [Thermoanaerobaculia bacterium]|nr:HAMP domain-containing sensor histidine kinase [Thermoanaerobaculia bacterium]
MRMSVSTWLTGSSPEGLAFTCDTSGNVLHVVHSSIGDTTVGGSLFDCLEPSSQTPCTIFFRAAVANGFARSMPLRLGAHELHCFGFRPDDVVRIVAVAEPRHAASIAEVAAQLSGDDGFRALADEIRRTHSIYDVYEDLARLNNDLVTAQRELARSIGELTRLNDFKNELLGMAAHDLRNPLNASLAFVTFLLEDEASFSDSNRLLLRRLKTSNAFMLRLVEDVLDFSAIESGRVRLHLQDSNLGEVVQSVIDTMRVVAERRRITIHYDVQPDLPILRVDRIKLTQSVQNLVANAVAYSPEGASVFVRITRDERNEVIAVEDHGPGIPADELPQVFEPFTRLSTATQSGERSVGLGMAITKRMVVAHGGTIEVASVEGHGATFTIRLPIPAA